MKHLITTSVLLVPIVLASASCAHSPEYAPTPDSLAGACGSVHVPGRAPEDPSADTEAPGDRVGPITVGLLEDPDPAHAPVPRSSSERIVFGHLYETLIRVDCRGEYRPGLATAWTQREDGRRWTFALREGARFWDETPVRPRDVVASWAAAARQLRGGRDADPPLASRVPRPRHFTVKDDRSFEIVFSPPYPDSPADFAHPATAVTGARAGSAWPAGTGTYRPAAPDGSRRPEGPVLAVRAATEAAGAPPRVRFRLPRGGDARDLLDADVDVLVTRESEVLSYAAGHPEYLTVPLRWDRLYVLVTPAGDTATEPSEPSEPSEAEEAERAANADERTGSDPNLDALREALARDVVRSEARAARATASGRPAGPGSGRILYPRDDADARALAERLVALAASPDGSSPATPAAVRALGHGTRAPRAVGMARGSLAAALRERGSGSDEARPTATDALVVPVSRRAAGAWDWREAGLPGGLGDGVLPLVETRARLVLRRGVPGIAVDGTGILKLAGGRP